MRDLGAPWTIPFELLGLHSPLPLFGNCHYTQNDYRTELYYFELFLISPAL